MECRIGFKDASSLLLFGFGILRARGVERGDAGDLGAVPVVVGVGGSKPGVEDLIGDWLSGGAQAEGEDVGMVPDTGAAGGLGVVAEGGADAMNLVSGDGGAGAGPAADDAFIGLAGSDRTGDVGGDERPIFVAVRSSPGKRTEGENIMAAAAQLRDEEVGEVGLLIGADGDLHGDTSRSLEGMTVMNGWQRRAEPRSPAPLYDATARSGGSEIRRE